MKCKIIINAFPTLVNLQLSVNLTDKGLFSLVIKYYMAANKLDEFFARRGENRYNEAALKAIKDWRKLSWRRYWKALH